ncbi:MAG: extracellular solute-binding protein [Candidatus Omnitrophica bacterium]|nr:extracellular solute-binding protein [Candidatus Omnitrophota bacterium]
MIKWKSLTPGGIMTAHKIFGAVAVCIGILCGGCAGTETADNGITLWHWMTDRDEAFQELADRYTEETGIPVKIKLFFPPGLYSQKVIAAARAGNLPEIFGILGEKKTLSSFIQAGHVENLTPRMNAQDAAWESRFYPETLAVVRFEEDNAYGVSRGIYGVPVDTTVLQFIYNTELMEEAGLDPDAPPKNYAQFIDAGQKARETLGIDGFICGWAEGWLLNALATEWAINIMGEEKFQATIAGEIAYTNPQWIEVFTLFEDLRESGILANNITTITNKEAEDAFARGNALFSFNGSWAVNVYRQLSPGMEYRFFALPQVSDDHPVKIWGGAGSAFMVNANSPLKAKASDFLEWLTEKEQQKYLVAETNNLPAVKMQRESLPVILRPLVDDLGALTHPNVWPYNEDSRVLEAMNRGLQQIVMGIKEPNEVAEKVQSIKDRVTEQ